MRRIRSARRQAQGTIQACPREGEARAAVKGDAALLRCAPPPLGCRLKGSGAALSVAVEEVGTKGVTLRPGASGAGRTKGWLDTRRLRLFG